MSNTPTTDTPASIDQRHLGQGGPLVSAIGLGCMGMSEFYGAIDNARNLRTLKHALDHGINFLDTADVYGPHTNEQLIGEAITSRREEVFLATKCAILRDPADPMKRGIDNRPEFIRQSCEGSLRRLKVDTIDLYYLHRHNPESATIEDAVGAMADLVKEGKVRYLGLSEVGVKTLERAHRVHPITALQTEYSLWSREPEEDGTLAFCRENKIGFVPYSPIGRGFLSGAIRRFEDLAADDFRRELPRFQGENFAKNLEIVAQLERMAKARGVTATQLAIAWVLAQGETIVPIPGTTRVEHLDQLIEATRIKLTVEEVKQISSVFPLGQAAGHRYYSTMVKYLGR
jgi:aryl-alcohol dehydrogenase-like predicted oxidoreductase